MTHYRIRQCYADRHRYYTVDKRYLLLWWAWTGTTFGLLEGAQCWIDRQKVTVNDKSIVIEYR